MSWLDFLPDISLPDHVDIDIIDVGHDIEGDLIQGDEVSGDQISADYAIKSGETVVPINKIERVVPGELPGEAPVELREKRNELIIDPENLEEPEEWDTVVKPGLKKGWREEGAVSTREAYPILLQAERNVNDEKISGIKDFFSDKIFTSDYLLLQSSLVIDRAMNAEEGEWMTDEELKQRKQELAEKYHDASYSLPSMCTSGYFDEGELFRQVYQKMGREPQYDVDDYDSVFRKMILHKPFVAYAMNSQSEKELLDIVLGKISRLSDYDIPLPYVDVRGIGKSNHQKIRNVMEAVEEQHEGVKYDERVGDEELVVRIDAQSISSTN